jgi:RNA polymerase sigma-70 factor (ECF subfamily)
MNALAPERRRDDLAQRAGAGDLAAFEAIYRENLGRIYALCLRMSADPVLADELTQRAFVRAWQKLGQFRGESGVQSWLFRLAVNVVLEDRRSAARQVVRLTESGSSDEKAPTPPHPGERMDLERAIAGLPDGARQVFVLHDVEGWPHDDIAAALGVTVGTSKSQLHRARSLLREALPR